MDEFSQYSDEYLDFFLIILLNHKAIRFVLMNNQDYIVGYTLAYTRPLPHGTEHMVALLICTINNRSERTSLAVMQIEPSLVHGVSTYSISNDYAKFYVF